MNEAEAQVALLGMEDLYLVGDSGDLVGSVPLGRTIPSATTHNTNLSNVTTTRNMDTLMPTLTAFGIMFMVGVLLGFAIEKKH